MQLAFRSLLPLLGALFAAPAWGQVGYPAGAEYGYAWTAESSTSLPGFANPGSSSQILNVPDGATSLSLSDGLGTPILAILEQFDFFTTCVTTWTAEITPPSPASSGWAKRFDLQAGPDSIRFKSRGARVHTHQMLDPCCQGDVLDVSSRIDGAGGVLFVPFDLAVPTTATLHELSRSTTWSGTSEVGAGSFTTSESGFIRLQLFTNLGEWELAGGLTDAQFTQPFSLDLPPGSYGLLIQVASEEALTSVPQCSTYTVQSTATDLVSLRLDFD